MGVEWVDSGRLLVHPDTPPKDIARHVAGAEVVQFQEQLGPRLSHALAEALSSRPGVELYVYGHDGQVLDGGLDFLRGFEHVERLSLNLAGLTGVDGLARFTALRSLTLQGMARRNIGLAPIEHASGLQRLALDQPFRDLHVIRGLGELAELSCPATATALESLDGHPSLRRLSLHYGTHRDLSPLESCPRLTDINLWQISKLTAMDLRPVARVPDLDALDLGALRNVTTLSWLDDTRARLRFLSLERLTGLDSYEPLSRRRDLVAFGAWESRPADHSLAALHQLPLVDLVLGDVYPPDEIAALLEHSAAHVAIRGETYRGKQRLFWRCLDVYVDAYRARTSH